MRRALSPILAGLVLLGSGSVFAGVQSSGAKDIPPDVVQVIKKHCATCHTGSNPPKGLNLVPSKIALAIGAPSKEIPELKLIDTANPESGYLLKKIEGAQGITGAKMPKGRTMPPADLDLLKAWILSLKAK